MDGGEQPMAGQGILYTVKGPRGSYYAIHDPPSGRVWTERTEQAARAQALDMGIALVGDEVISHEELLRRTGREMPEASSAPLKNTEAATGPAPLVISKDLSRKGDDALVLQSSTSLGNGALFASRPLLSEPLVPESPPAAAFSTGEIISSALPPTPSDDNSGREPSSL
jgi:hypothetical protein